MPGGRGKSMQMENPIESNMEALSVRTQIMDNRGQPYLQRRTTTRGRASRYSLLETYVVAAAGSEVHSCLLQLSRIQHSAMYGSRVFRSMVYGSRIQCCREQFAYRNDPVLKEGLVIRASW